MKGSISGRISYRTIHSSLCTTTATTTLPMLKGTSTTGGGPSSWFRQFQVLVTKNRRLLSRRPIHLFVLILSSVASVVFAWLAGRDARGKSGDFPPLTDCGMVDPEYYQEQTIDRADSYSYYYGGSNIPMTLNEPWRGGLPIWLMSLGPTFVGISVFLILRDELQSRLWGTLKAADSSAHWLSWLFVFTIIGIVNSLAGGITAAVMPNVHAMESVNFGSVFGSLLFLNVALVAASFFLAALCGTIQSTTLTVFLIMGMIVASSAPAIAASTTSFSSSYGDGAGAAISTYHESGSGGAFWVYGSTERWQQSYNYGEGIYDPDTGEFIGYDSTSYDLAQCQVPLLSHEQGHTYKTPDERDNVPKEDIFLGCYVIAGGGAATTGVSSFFWYFLPQYHFLAAWSNILGYTSLPGNKFSLAEASQSPEMLAQKSLANLKGGKGYDLNNTSGTSLFPQGSTILTARYSDYLQNEEYNSYYGYSYVDDNPNPYEPKSTCPSSEVVPNMCNDYPTSDCNHVKSGYPTEGSSVNDSLGYLASLVIIYSILAAYIAAVIPMGNGAANKFYFPFLKSFWCRSRRSSEDEVQDGIEAIDVSKSYGNVEALKPFSLTMQPSQVTALLGHNGAGKSTFVNLLCCGQNPTGGDIRVQGHSLVSDQHAISKMIGECKQDDILWPSLTAREHLELFGGIRGVSSEDMAETVQRWLESVDLENVQHMRVSAFSGGMKRRLSVALATIGDAKIVVLDEPTTGMDPVSRRFVWKHISEIKAGRVILLTTHAMEEADMLSDVVAILSQGTLAAYGSPLELKTQHGSALQFTIICTEKENTTVVQEAVNSTFADSLPYIEFEAGESSYSTLTIKKVCKDKDSQGVGVPVNSLSTFIGWLEDENSPVSEFGISNSSLEEVFLAVTRHAGPAEAHDENESSGCCCFGCGCSCGKRRPKTTAEETTVHLESLSVLPLPSQHMNQAPRVDISSHSRKLSVMAQTKAIVRFFFARNWTGRPSIVNWTIFSIFVLANMITGFGMAQFWPDPTLFLFLIVTVSLLSSMLLSVISPIYSDRSNGNFKMLSTQSMMKNSFIFGTSIYSLLVQFIYSFIFLTIFFGSTIFREPVVCESSDYECGYVDFGEKPTIRYDRKEVLSGVYDGNEVTVFAHVSPGGYEMILGVIVVFSFSFPGAVLSTAFLPGFKITLVGVALVLLLACVSPVILYAVKMSDPLSLENCMEVYAENITPEREFTLDNVDGDFVKWVGWKIIDPTTLPLLFCNPAHVSILPQLGLFQTLALTLISDIVFYSDQEGFAELFVDKLAQGGQSCSGNRCKFEHVRTLYGQNLGFMFLGGALLMILGVVMAILILNPPTCMVRARHAVGHLFKCGRKREKETSTEEIEEMKEVDTERQRVHSIMQAFVAGPEDVEANDSPDPALSDSAIHNDRDQLPPVVMHKLRKVYKALGGAKEMVALKSLDLHVPKGEVLGLLGKNGAGKTTALKILAGMHEASSGIGLISGYDVATELNSVYERLGNCPQFDCVWKNQSVQRHLEFYARLKGIDDPGVAAMDIANAVGLAAPDVYTRASGALSGGMRRRLSIAVSLLGSPDTLLLDEPTTGLDPSTRNEIWSLLSSFATPERAIIITTHMMLEADALCNRIAIVAKGSLKVIGTQQHLKDNYGSGYLLQLNLVQDTEQAIDSLLQFVKSNIHEEAKIATKQAKTIHINLPRDVNIQKIFTTLYSDDAAEAMINQFLVSQSSLEDVFLALGE